MCLSFYILFFYLVSNIYSTFSFRFLYDRYSPNKVKYNDAKYHLKRLTKLNNKLYHSNKDNSFNKKESFDFVTSLILASYAFESYNDIVNYQKLSYTKENVKIRYKSNEIISFLFDGSLVITLDKGSIKFENSPFLEQIFTGSQLDPYVIIQSRRSKQGSTIFKHYYPEVDSNSIDSIRSTTQSNNNIPVWKESYTLHTSIPTSTLIVFNVFDQQLFGEDIFLGNAYINLEDIVMSINDSIINKEGVKEIKLPIPIYIDNAVDASFQDSSHNNNFLKSLLSVFKSNRNKRIRMGTLSATFRYEDSQHMTVSSSTINSSIMNNPLDNPKNHMRKYLPTGATPHEVNWADLLEIVLSKQQPTNSMNIYSEEKVLLSEPAGYMHPHLSSIDTNTTTDDDTTSSSSSSATKTSYSSNSKLSDSLSRGTLQQFCEIESVLSDTQVLLWVDLSQKQLVIGFRGTETTKVQDLLTDINLLQVPYQTDNDILELDGVTVHQGFLLAYKSIRYELMRHLQLLFNNHHTDLNQSYQSSIPPTNTSSFTSSNMLLSKGGWDIYITGHSLGGGLAKLLSFDLARMQANLINTTSINEIPFCNNQDFMSTLQQSSLYTYTYGAPRVGNSKFVSLFNNYIPHCFCVVNQQDVVARLPRSSNLNIMDYAHVGRTVMLEEDSSNINTIPIIDINSNNNQINTTNNKDNNSTFESKKMRLWIEGESEGINPLNDISPTSILPANVLNAITNITNIYSMNNNSNVVVPSIQNNLLPYFNNAFASILSTSSKQQSNSNNVNEPNENILMKSLQDISKQVDIQFFERELQLLASLMNKTSLEHHLEPSYYNAFRNNIHNMID